MLRVGNAATWHVPAGAGQERLKTDRPDASAPGRERFTIRPGQHKLNKELQAQMTAFGQLHKGLWLMAC
jgi:hypothetical protein